MQNRKIVPFQYRHADKVSNLIRKTLRTSNSPFYPESVITFLYKEHSKDHILEMAETRDLFVAKKNSTIIGVGGLEGNYVGTVFVHPEYQNQGIGRAIMEKLEAKAKEKGIEKVVLKASINAVPFYKNIGYTEIKEVHDENYGTTLKMAKKL